MSPAVARRLCCPQPRWHCWRQCLGPGPANEGAATSRCCVHLKSPDNIRRAPLFHTWTHRLYSWFGEVSVPTICLFLNWVVCSLLSSLCVLETSLLSDVCTEVIFSQSALHLVIPVTASLQSTAVFCILIKPVFLSRAVLSVLYLKHCRQTQGHPHFLQVPLQAVVHILHLDLCSTEVVFF